MATEDVSLFDEIEEELKQDKMYANLKKHKNSITAGLVVAVFGIVAYSSWYSQKQNKLEGITTALVDVLRNPGSEKSAKSVEGFAEEAPAEIKPLLVILKAGRHIQLSKAVKENADELLALTKKEGVDIVWKDLALLVCASHNLIDGKSFVATLEPLTEENRPFKFMAMELIAFWYLNEKQEERATQYFQKILDHGDAPKTLKDRIFMILNHIKNKSEK